MDFNDFVVRLESSGIITDNDKYFNSIIEGDYDYFLSLTNEEFADLVAYIARVKRTTRNNSEHSISVHKNMSDFSTDFASRFSGEIWV